MKCKVTMGVLIVYLYGAYEMVDASDLKEKYLMLSACAYYSNWYDNDT